MSRVYTNSKTPNLKEKGAPKPLICETSSLRRSTDKNPGEKKLDLKKEVNLIKTNFSVI